MRRTVIKRALAAALASVLAIAVSACSSEPPAKPPVAVEVSTDTGSRPQIDFTAPLTIPELEIRTVVAGTGDEIAEGDQVLLEAVLLSADSQEVQIDTWSRVPKAMHVTIEEMGEALYTAIVGAQVGARLLVLEPAEQLEGTDARVVVVDVLPAKATGEAVEPRPGMPVVSVPADGAPTITVNSAETPPSELTVQPLLRGTGQQVLAGQTVTIQYEGVRWDTGEVFDTTWSEDGGPRSYVVGTGEMPPGLDIGLLEQTVGSRTLLVIPAELGSLDIGTTVFVVDILAVSGEPTPVPDAR